MAIDSYFDAVDLLVDFDGSDASTTFTDRSKHGRAISVFGNAQVDTAQSLFGGASLLLDGTGDYLSLADADAWDVAGSKTIEIAFRTASASGPLFTKGIVGTGTFGSSAGWCIGHFTGNLSVRLNSTLYQGSGTITVGAWHRVALVWDQPGNTFKVFLDGTQVYSGAYAAVTTSTALIIGNVSPVDGNRYFDGHVDEARVTTGVARRTGTYTPDAEAFSYVRGGWAEIASALGAVEALGTALVAGYASDAGMLGEPFARGHLLYGFAADSGPLGAPSVRGHLLYGTATVDGPLGAASALGLHDFTAALGDAVTYYVCDLETPGGLVRVPISSWQATMQVDEMCYVQCVVPACTDWVEDLGDATEFVISRRVVLADDSSLEYEMARAPLQTLSLAQGPTNYSATLSGYTAALTADDDPPAVYDRDLTGVRAIFVTGGNVRARSSIDWLLRPGHRAFAGETEIVVDFISYYVGGGDAYMDVGQRA